ncbi:MAG TPA: hypothetical protein VK506_06095, partial [Conexibacter sp.]|nr:hypothetical protein [Conexibacter sp.]
MFTVRKLATAVGDMQAAVGAARYLLDPDEAPQAYTQAGGAGDLNLWDGGHDNRVNSVWMGSRSALKQLGIEWGTEVSEGHLVSALQGQHVLTGKQVRKKARIQIRKLNKQGQPKLQKD